MPPNTAPHAINLAEHEPHHHAPEEGVMKRVDSYWKEPHAATETDKYWEDPMTAHGKHIPAEEEEATHAPTHHPVEEGMKRVGSYWKENPHDKTGDDKYWNDPAEAHEKKPTTEIAEEHKPPHHPVDPAMPRVDSYWKEPHAQSKADEYWNDPQLAHGHLMDKGDEHKPIHHPVAGGMPRVDSSYWKEPHGKTAQDTYWEDPANAHGKPVEMDTEEPITI